MADPRFYDRLGPLTLTEIAALSGAAISDSGTGDAEVDRVTPLGEPVAGALSYAEKAKLLRTAPDGALAGVVLICPEAATEDARRLGAVVLTHPEPRAAFARVLPALFQARDFAADTYIDPTARIGEGTRLAAGVVVGAGAEIGRNCVIGPHSVVGPGCRVGDNTRLAARVSLLCCDIGADCNILAGAVIGEDGFGIAVSDGNTVGILHLGSVVIGDHVTIGANCAIDRGLFSATRIGNASKIDNLCHIAHNAVIGENVIMAGYSGLAGSAVLQDNAMLGGRVGIYDHVTIGKGARVGGNSAAARDVPAGEIWVGNPAQPMRQHLRELAELRRLARPKDKTSRKG
ncbi:UDP-3-O-(3-hydroxymyristoyl)glucosamine N-acyltransferase [Maricaulis sp.]|uniref:UDP-3-O-(3-hydroxymyristoyl)glucosamine N-acyltransferase n=1 Tax=Maricaulis sp. TaxID=1486257 RepID=UPI002B27152A|nr:UDP-3-O-(3-hydroxymyristoyl)glucosamine N-acyltransferase [Maricaulis sp.]